MAAMNMSLPDAMKNRVEAQARTGRYSNASDDRLKAAPQRA